MYVHVCAYVSVYIYIYIYINIYIYIFFFNYLFFCCLSVVLSLEKRDFSENLHTVCPC